VELFVDRARRVDPGFRPTAEELVHAGRICRLVEGMPLAVELAAAWVPILPCEEIADEIERGLDFLEASARDAPDRHRTIRAVFDYSWNLLDPAQQEAFCGMSVFSAPFTRPAVDATVGADLRTLTELVGKSLVRRVGSDRFDLHPLLRQYAAEKTDPMTVGRLRERHARHYLVPLVGRRNDLKGSPDQAKARLELSGDIGNVIPAVEWATTHWSDAEIVDVLETLMRYYEIQSWSEGRERFRDLVDKIAAARSIDENTLLTTDLPGRRAMLAQGLFAASIGLTDEALSIVGSQRDLSWEADPPGRLWREVVVGIAEGMRGDYSAAERCFAAVYDEALDLADPYLVVFLCTWYGWMLLELGDTGGARDVFEVARSTAIRENDTHGLAYVLSKIGLLADVSGDHRQAAIYHLEARETFLEFDDIGGQGYTLSRLAWTHWLLGEYAEARRYGLEGLELFEGNNHRWGVGVSLCRVGFAEIGLGDLTSARARFEEALDRSLEVQLDGITAYALIGIGNVLAASGEGVEAVEILSVADRHPAVPDEYKRDYVEPVLTRLRGDMGPDGFETAAARSVDWTVEDVIAAARVAPG
jgi:tetratricopeptide (TPR) repeat protein